MPIDLTVLLWSAALLHRQKTLKWIGAMGAVASTLPVLFLIAGHISIGLGAALGVSMLFDIQPGQSLLGSAAVNIFEAIFRAWLLHCSLNRLLAQPEQLLSQ